MTETIVVFIFVVFIALDIVLNNINVKTNQEMKMEYQKTLEEMKTRYQESLSTVINNYTDSLADMAKQYVDNLATLIKSREEEKDG